VGMCVCVCVCVCERVLPKRDVFVLAEIVVVWPFGKGQIADRMVFIPAIIKSCVMHVPSGIRGEEIMF
jgi:hypothetical protein